MLGVTSINRSQGLQSAWAITATTAVLPLATAVAVQIALAIWGIWAALIAWAIYTGILIDTACAARRSWVHAPSVVGVPSVMTLILTIVSVQLFIFALAAGALQAL